VAGSASNCCVTVEEISQDTPGETVRTRLSRRAGAAVGVVAVAAALGAGQLVAGFIAINASPFLAVGSAAIDLSPVWLKDFAVRTFGTHDKLVLLSGMAVAVAVLAVLAGMAARRSPVPGLAVVTVFGVAGVLAVTHRPDLSGTAVLAPVTSLLVGLGVFAWLWYRVRAVAGGEAEVRGGGADAGGRPSRRSVVLAGVGVLVGSAAAAVGGQVLSGTRDATASRAAVGRLVPARAAPAVAPGADFAVFGTPSFLTANRDFYRVDTALSVPQVRTEDWSLRLHGMVDHERRYSYADIRSRPLVERTVTMTCVSNEVGGTYLSTANFVGVDLSDLLADAGVRAGAQQLLSTSVDGWTAGSPIEVTRDPGRGAMLAIGMNGEPLPIEHGFPARLVIPGLYGYVSATKWVTELEVTTWQAAQPYWLRRGWGRVGPIKTESRIDRPRGFDTVPAGTVRVAGVSWAQHVGIAGVQVSLDNGPWLPATLATEVNVDTWRMWMIDITVPSGTHQVTCRATDKSGYTQTDARAATVPDGATGWHSITFTAR
jgi:DMSO/TMAO reductase YedYZ molybdopterin-dependent catalytic subunit